jgi:anti-sigma regulatory factor (Ser/Thr protein kinase)
MPRIVRLSLHRDATAAAAARKKARDTLSRWRLDALADSVVLVVSELVTNAVRYGRQPIGLTMRARQHDVCVEVRDANPALPSRDNAPDTAESGRGMDIVETVASTSGVIEIPGDGKDVFATFELPDTSEPHPAPQES